jgi:hypothetical protein
LSPPPRAENVAGERRSGRECARADRNARPGHGIPQRDIGRLRDRHPVHPAVARPEPELSEPEQPMCPQHHDGVPLLAGHLDAEHGWLIKMQICNGMKMR